MGKRAILGSRPNDHIHAEQADDRQRSPGPRQDSDGAEGGRHHAGAALAALGIVYGDLGTSPLYTLQAVIGASGGHLTPEFALGILSLIFWALLITISLKYCVFVMRADNHGEGGILALMSLVGRNSGEKGLFLVTCGLFGAALIYGDGIITPAISVLSALEGVNVATPALKPFIMPVAVAILLGLFGCQQLGTARIGKIFGPVMTLWFVTIGVIGAVGVVRHPAVVAAVNPVHAVRFLADHGWGSFAALGGVFLAVTGGEALYADMGHIGRNPIRSSWYGLVLPALLLSYAGQTALLLDQPDMTDNPFFKIVPGWGLYPMVGLATLATIIASQAIITGSFSLTRQAMQLGWFPGLWIHQTSDREYGQIYVPTVNWVMMVFTIALTIGFGSSDRLAGAYGTAVSTTMLLTTILLGTAMRERWHWSLPLVLAVCGAFLIVDLGFFAANLLKIAEGGWIPLLFGSGVFLIMTTWRKGVTAVRTRLFERAPDPEEFLRKLQAGAFPRIDGTAVFLSRSAAPVPPLLAWHAKQFGALHKSLVSLTVRFEEVPRLDGCDRIAIDHVAENFWHVTVHFGFLEVPNLPAALECARDMGCMIELDKAIYFGAADEVVHSLTGPALLSGWRVTLFGFLNRNAIHAVDRFQLPVRQFVEIGRQMEL
ncbi:MAG: KUP/HAK/KT family potassium transporter [Aliidongia sp.]